VAKAGPAAVDATITAMPRTAIEPRVIPRSLFRKEPMTRLLGLLMPGGQQFRGE
jgi:hypothetical protein